MFVLIAALLVAFAAPACAQDLLIKGVQIVSPETAAPYGPVDVSVRDGRIAEIGNDLSQAGFAPDQIVDGSGLFLAPGLMDSHVHLSTIPGMHRGHEAQFPEIVQKARAQIPRSYLYYGFTSVVDLIADSASMAQWNDQDVRPHAYYSGAAPIMDGYPTHRIPKEWRYSAMPNFLYDPTRPDEFPTGLNKEDHSPEAVVARIAADGAVAVKTFYEDGFGSAKDIPVPPQAVLIDLVAAAHERDLPVILHANSEDAQAAGLRAGVDAFVHGLWTWDSADSSELTVPIKTILNGIIEQNIAWQPTIQVLYGERDLFDPDFLKREDVAAAVPREVLDWYASEDGQWLTREMREFPYVTQLEAEGRWREINDQPIRHVLQALTYLAQNDGHLLFGSDSPSAPTYANPAGLNGRLEMDRWVEAGVSPRQILYAATLANAQFFGLEGELGSIELGKRADLLIMRENPLAGVEAYDSIELVILGGRLLPREELAANAER